MTAINRILWTIGVALVINVTAALIAYTII
ncbi:hypothetical protein VPHK24_0028 [Vibrio phage K24]